MEYEIPFVNRLYSADEAVVHASAQQANRPIVLADAQDNPGAGVTSDTTGILEALVKNKAKGAVMAAIYDPEVAKIAPDKGIGGAINVAVGAKSGFASVSPYSAEFIVESLGDGNFTFTGDMYKNSPAQLGLITMLKVISPDTDVRVIISSIRVQCLDLAIFRHLGVEPSEQRILVVKSSVHFRADFEPIAEEILAVASAGAHPCQLEHLQYKNLRKGVRLGPNGAENK